jgi:hypothetical protein
MMRIAILALILSGTAAVAGAKAAEKAAATAFSVLTCDMASASDPTSVQRVFRIAPHSLQQWDPARRGFGPNLCLSFACSADAHRTTGTISSASLNVTISLDQATRQATWKTVGASGLTKPAGTCTVGPDPLAAARNR